MTEREEKAYVEGSRRVWISTLATCLKQLGVDDPEDGKARWVMERQEAIAMLRGICADHGDNEWDDDLHLADVLDKHLGDHLNASSRGSRLFSYSGTSCFIVIRATDREHAAQLFLKRYPQHLKDNASSIELNPMCSPPTTEQELADRFSEMEPNGPAEIVEDFIGYDGGF